MPVYLVCHARQTLSALPRNHEGLGHGIAIKPGPYTDGADQLLIPLPPLADQSALSAPDAEMLASGGIRSKTAVKGA